MRRKFHKNIYVSLSRSMQFELHSHSKNQQVRNWSKYHQAEYRNYFSDAAKIQSPLVSSIITELSLKKTCLSSVTQMLQQYLQIHQNSNPSEKSPQDLIRLLVALELSGFRQFQKHNRSIVEHLIMLENEQLRLDPRSVGVFIKVVQDLRRSVLDSTKSSYLKYLLMNTIKSNFEYVQISLYPILIKIIQEQGRKWVFEPFRFIQVADLMQEKMHHIFKGELRKMVFSQKYRVILTSDLIERITEIHQLFGSAQPEYAQTLFEFITQRYFEIRMVDQNQAVSAFNSLYRHFPCREESASGKTYKRMLLQNIIEKYQTNQRFKQLLFKSRQGKNLCLSMITHCFSECFRRLPLAQNQDFSYLTAVQLSSCSVPELPNIFWQIYTQISQQLNQISYFKSIIQVCYRQKYIEKRVQVNQEVSLETNDTQMRIRVSEVLKQLRIQSKSESLVGGRYVDFELANRVVLQMDGSHHFCARNMNLKESTEFRNMHLLFIGYRLITLSIYEYNINREKDDLAALIAKKLRWMEEKDAVFVW